MFNNIVNCCSSISLIVIALGLILLFVDEAVNRYKRKKESKEVIKYEGIDKEILDSKIDRIESKIDYLRDDLHSLFEDYAKIEDLVDEIRMNANTISNKED